MVALAQAMQVKKSAWNVRAPSLAKLTARHQEKWLFDVFQTIDTGQDSVELDFGNGELGIGSSAAEVGDCAIATAASIIIAGKNRCAMGEGGTESQGCSGSSTDGREHAAGKLVQLEALDKR